MAYGGDFYVHREEEAGAKLTYFQTWPELINMVYFRVALGLKPSFSLWESGLLDEAVAKIVEKFPSPSAL